MERSLGVRVPPRAPLSNPGNHAKCLDFRGFLFKAVSLCFLVFRRFSDSNCSTFVASHGNGNATDSNCSTQSNSFCGPPLQECANTSLGIPFGSFPAGREDSHEGPFAGIAPDGLRRQPGQGLYLLYGDKTWERVRRTARCGNGRPFGKQPRPSGMFGLWDCGISLQYCAYSDFSGIKHSEPPFRIWMNVQRAMCVCHREIVYVSLHCSFCGLMFNVGFILHSRSKMFPDISRRIAPRCWPLPE